MKFVQILLAGLLIFSVFPAIKAQESTFVPQFESAACPFELPSDAVEGEDIDCGYVTVPEEHATPDGNTIRLAVAVIHSTDENPESPLVMAQGGPGGSTLDIFVNVMLSPFGDLFRASRDIILFDQRGTLYSEPALVCDETFEMVIDTLDQDLTLEESTGLHNQAVLACYQRLLEEGINLSAFDSVENAADVPMVVEALGYNEYNFYGVSYGSLLAFHLLRDHPENLRSVIVDAIVPTQVNFIPATPVNGIRALRLLFETCAADAECNSHFPNLEATYLQLLEDLNTNPVTVQIQDPETDKTHDLLVNDDMLVSLTFSSLYVTELLPALPKYIYEMTQGNFNWLRIYGGEFLLNRSQAEGMHLSVMCAEDSDFLAEEVQLEGTYPLYERVLELFAQSYLELCPQWQVEALESFVDDPVVSDIPTLIMSGQFDPITPPIWGEIAGETLSNGYVYEFSWVGHGSLFGGICPVTIALSFLDNPAEAPDASCAEEVQLIFAAPAAGIFETDQFSVEIPLGWEDTSTDAIATFTDPTTGTIFNVLGVEATDVHEGIEKILAEVKPEMSAEPLDSSETELLGRMWTQHVYLNGFNVVMVLATAESDTVVALVVEAGADSFESLASVLTSVWLSLQIK